MNKRTEELLRDLREPSEIQDLDYALARLEAREKYPAVYRRFRDIHEARLREEQREADAREIWELAGGDVADFPKHWKELSAQRRVEAIKSADAQAEADSWASTRGGF